MFDSALPLRYKGLMVDNQIPPIESGDNRGERMQRIRVGLTGLAVVLLLIVLATVLFNSVGNKANPSANALAPTSDEPLAELGVAPGAPANETTEDAVPAPK
jgi:hypothetical protein